MNEIKVIFGIHPVAAAIINLERQIRRFGAWLDGRKIGPYRSRAWVCLGEVTAARQSIARVGRRITNTAQVPVPHPTSRARLGFCSGARKSLSFMVIKKAWCLNGTPFQQESLLCDDALSHTI